MQTPKTQAADERSGYLSSAVRMNEIHRRNEVESPQGTSLTRAWEAFALHGPHGSATTLVGGKNHAEQGPSARWTADPRQTCPPVEGKGLPRKSIQLFLIEGLEADRPPRSERTLKAEKSVGSSPRRDGFSPQTRPRMA